MEDYAERVRAARIAHGYSRADLAVKAGVSYSTITKAEQGQRVGIVALVKLFAVLDPTVTVGDLAAH
jgi:transcriptional regulator with XRE-family HTH domain